MPLEPRAGNAAAHLLVTARPVVLHRQRVPRRAAGRSRGGRSGQQLHGHVYHDGRRHVYVRAASAQEPDTGRRQTRPRLRFPRS